MPYSNIDSLNDSAGSSGNKSITNSTISDTCNFPSIRFGRYYTSRIAQDTVVGAEVTHPDPVSYTEEVVSTGTTVTNSIKGLPSVTSETDTSVGATVVASADDDKVNVNVENTSVGATVSSAFGGIASDAHVTRTSRGATVIGKSCGPN